MSVQSDWIEAANRFHVVSNRFLDLDPLEVFDAQTAYKLADAALAAAQIINPWTTVTRLQALLALEAGGYLATVDAYMATLARGNSSRIAWENAQVFERTSPIVAAMGAMLGLNDAAIDALFITASNI